MEEVSDAPCLNSTMSIILDLPPSCVEFVPFNHELFVIGTYNLESNDINEPKLSISADQEQGAIVGKKSQSRSGSLLLYQLADECLYTLPFQVEGLGKI